MSRRGLPALLGFLVLLGSPAAVAYAQDEAAKVSTLLRDLKSPDFETAFHASESLGRHPAYQARIVPALQWPTRTTLSAPATRRSGCRRA